MQRAGRLPDKKRRKNKDGNIPRYIALIVVLVLLLGPLIVPLLGAFKSPGEPLFGRNASLLPQEWSLAAFRELFHQIPITRYMLNSLTVGVLAVASQVVFATTSGYMLSRRGWKGRTVVYLLLLSSMIFPFESIMLSLFAQMRDLGLVDTLVGVWVPNIVTIFCVLIMRAAFMGVPDEIEDAALLDGAGEFRRFFGVFLPQVRGAMTVIILMTFIWAWDDFLWPLIMLRSDENFTLMLGLQQLQGQFGFDYRVVLAGAVTALVPITALFLMTQRYFFKGMEDGGVKI